MGRAVHAVLKFMTNTILLFITRHLYRGCHAFDSLLTNNTFTIFCLAITVTFRCCGLFSRAMTFVVLIFIALVVSVLTVLCSHHRLTIVSLINNFVTPFLIDDKRKDCVILFACLSILGLKVFNLSLCGG